jgi:hypothetical protein
MKLTTIGQLGLAWVLLGPLGIACATSPFAEASSKYRASPELARPASDIASIEFKLEGSKKASVSDLDQMAEHTQSVDWDRLPIQVNLKDSPVSWKNIPPPSLRCPQSGAESDETLSTILNLSVERLNLLKLQRALTNTEICNLPTSRLVRALFKTEPVPMDSPGEALKFRQLQQSGDNGLVDPIGYQRALQQRIEIQSASPARPAGAGISSNRWTEMGPGNIGGRVRAVAVYPSNNNKIWVGSVSGGLWTSNNAGATWNVVNDFLPSVAISSIVFDPTNPLIMYAGTGEGFYNGDGIQGLGIFRSLDGGISWNQLPSTNPATGSHWYWVNRIAIHPLNGNIILAATVNGTYRSSNAGASWNLVNNFRALDVKFDPLDGNIAVVGRDDGSVSYSSDAGVSWNSSQLVPGNYRVEIALTAAARGVVFASVALNGGAIFKSTNFGRTWAQISTPGHLGNQGWYANTIAISPVNPNKIYIGGLDLYGSNDGGFNFSKLSTWFLSPNSPHADHHSIVMDPGFNGLTNRRVYIGNDGGLYRADNIEAVNSGSVNNGWTNLNNGLGITQFYSGAGYTGGRVIGGTQDNGSLVQVQGSSNWNTFYGGDGGYSAIDTSNSNYFYGEYVFLSIFRTTDGGVTAKTICGGITDGYADPNFGCPGGTTRANFIAPFILDPNDNNTMLAGGASLWRSSNVKATTPSWVAVKASTVPPPNNFNYISAIAVAMGNSSNIWVGHNNGEIYKTTNGTSVNPIWSRVGLALPRRMVTRIVVDNANANVVYVTYGGYNSGNIQKSTDGGATWSDISVGLPAAPVRDIARHPSKAGWLYAGTEVGVFTSENGGLAWFTSNDGPGTVSVEQLFWLDNATLAAATHGRGFFKIGVDTSTNNCKNTLNTNSVSVGASRSTLTMNVTAAAGCAWSASSDSGWVTVTGGATGIGNGTVALALSENTSASSRVALVNIAGELLTINQSGAGTVPSCSLNANPSVIPRGQSVTLTVSCSPSASSFIWEGGIFASTALSGVVTPTSTTSYSVVGVNSSGRSAPAVATVVVSSTVVSAVDVRTFVPESFAPNGYVSFLRVINTGNSVTPITVARIDETTGVVSAAGVLTASLAVDAAVTFTAQQVETALGLKPLATERPRIRVSGINSTIEVQSFMLQPGGLFEEVSAAQVGSTVKVRTYIPAADSATGYVSYIRVINPSSIATPVTVSLIDGVTGVTGNSFNLVTSLAAGGARTFNSSQIESIIGSVGPGLRPRLKITGNVQLEVQSFITQPGGAFTNVSGGQ